MSWVWSSLTLEQTVAEFLFPREPALFADNEGRAWLIRWHRIQYKQRAKAVIRTALCWRPPGSAACGSTVSAEACILLNINRQEKGQGADIFTVSAGQLLKGTAWMKRSLCAWMEYSLPERNVSFCSDFCVHHAFLWFSPCLIGYCDLRALKQWPACAPQMLAICNRDNYY